MDSATQAFESLVPEQVQALVELLSGGVEFIIVGGYAMRYHGRLRKTNDLDIVVRQSEENIARLESALRMLPTKIPPDIAKHLMHPEKKLIWQSVELFSNMKGLDYEDLADMADHCLFQGMTVSILSAPHMKEAKRLALASPERREKWSTDETDLLFLECQGEA